MENTPNLTIMGSTSSHLFDPVGALQVDQIIAEAGEGVCMGLVASPIEVLAQEVKDGGEGAEVVLLLDMEF